jgi:hypothetical protein
MAIYIGVNGQVKEVTSGYIGNAKGEPIIIYTSDKLPDGYYPVRYVYSDARTNTSWLNIGAYTKNTRIICMCSSALDHTTYSYDATAGIVGRDSGTGSFDFYFQSGGPTDLHLITAYGSVGPSDLTYIPDGVKNNADVPISKRYVIDINRDTSYGTWLKYGTGSYNLLFNNTQASSPYGDNIVLNHSSSVDDGEGTKYYYIEIYDNIWTSTKPSKQLYPCIWNNSGTMVAGLYDTVGKQFYGNAQWENGPTVSSYDIVL